MTCRSLNDIAELGKSTPLQIVPLKRQPEAQSPLPKDLSPVTLRLAMEPHQSDTELPSADAQLPGTPDTYVSKVYQPIDGSTCLSVPGEVNLSK